MSSTQAGKFNILETTQKNSLKGYSSQFTRADQNQLRISFIEIVQKQFDTVSIEGASQQEIQKSMKSIRDKMHQFEQIISRKIDKYYPQLRPHSIEIQETAQDIISAMKNEKQLRNKLIQFQQHEINEIKQREKGYDSRQNIEFAIPIQISETKKKIEQVQKFIHVAKIKQKKKSQDLVKVDKTNLQQFERTAMLRTNLQVAMLYQINLNQREVKIDDHMYEFQKKIDNLNDKLEKLQKIVEQKKIFISSNKNLVQLKEKQALFIKHRDQQAKKTALIKNNIAKMRANLTKEIQNLKNELKEKQIRSISISEELSILQQKNKKYLQNTQLNNSLRKSISFNYAETLLKIRSQQRQKQILNKEKSNIVIRQNLSVKPNFKITKGTPKRNNQSLQKSANTSRILSLSSEFQPITHQKINPQGFKKDNRSYIQLKTNKVIKQQQKIVNNDQVSEDMIIQG